jgi:predicted DNA-binding transcriptional regulator AlpA
MREIAAERLTAGDYRSPEEALGGPAERDRDAESKRMDPSNIIARLCQDRNRLEESIMRLERMMPPKAGSRPQLWHLLPKTGRLPRPRHLSDTTIWSESLLRPARCPQLKSETLRVSVPGERLVYRERQRRAGIEVRPIFQTA